MTRPALMLVSASADGLLRREVADGLRPRPEYLVLEADHDVQLLDWSRLPGSPHSRSAWSSAIHVATALRTLGRHEVAFSDSEHVGIPLALAMRTLGVVTPHLVIGHHLSTPAKARAFRSAGAHRSMTRILVHSELQAELAHRELGIPQAKLVVVPYHADTAFWHPLDIAPERLVVAAGREHRDYAILAQACGTINTEVFVAAGSVHSPAATSREPLVWPANFRRGFAGYRALRELYARAGVVVVPLVETDFQAGVTTVLEAMSMGKAVVVTATKGLSRVVLDGTTGICVPPNNAAALHDAISFLLDNAAECRRLGEAAREAVINEWSVEAYAQRLAGHLKELGMRNRVAA